MPTGTIKKLVSDRGFGFIAAEEHHAGLTQDHSLEPVAVAAGFLPSGLGDLLGPRHDLMGSVAVLIHIDT